MSTMLLFKYVGPDAVSKVFERPEEVAIRFGLPKSYNDPYELFVEPEPPLDSEEERAFYDYFLGKVVEAPVACFSRRPDSVVMWAHYGREGSGICLGFDEDVLTDQFPIAYVGNVEYLDGPAAVDSGLVSYAFTTGKRRHTLRLLEIAHRSAYFTKRLDWRYEDERRVVVSPDAVEDRDGILIGHVAPGALRFIVIGPKAGESVRDICDARARQYGVPMLRFTTGARTYTPYFITANTGAVIWTGDAFTDSPEVCCDCGEPGDIVEDGRCQWCGISDDARNSAPRRSMLTASLYYGIDKGLPFVFDGLEPRGRLVNEWRSKRTLTSSPPEQGRVEDPPF
jgi:hypothetical protein